MTRPGFETGQPRWEAGDYPPELWRGLREEHRLRVFENRVLRRIFGAEER
jgi:hypothetical protein